VSARRWLSLVGARRWLTLGLVLGAARAHGAGLERPNVLGPRAIGLGGAFSAVADDPTAVWHNPAGTAIYGDNVVYLGGDLLLLGRSYTPSADSPLGMAGQTGTVKENTAPAFVPIVGATTRFGFGRQPPSRFALSVATYSIFGGAISFKPSDVLMKGVQSTQITTYEVAPALAYQVTDALSLGAALRIGIGSFDVDDLEATFHAKQSMSGIGIGGTLGALIRPHWRVQIAAVYHTPLRLDLSGNGPVSLAGQAPSTRNGTLHFDWPQSVSVGVAVRAHARLLVSVQGDWTGWSLAQQLDVNLEGVGGNIRELRYRDSYAVHLGLQGVITRYLLARLGWALDSNAIPDETVRRENQDTLKSTVAVGLGIYVWKIFFDSAFEMFLPIGDRKVATQVAAQNEAGKYGGSVYSLEGSAQIRF
jgi:long-chain fatty acid transport protein